MLALKAGCLAILFAPALSTAAVFITPNPGLAKLIYFDALESQTTQIKPYGEPLRAIPPQRCLGGFHTWTVGSAVCEGSLPQTSPHITKRVMSSNGSTGFADYRCAESGSYVLQAGSTCT